MRALGKSLYRTKLCSIVFVSMICCSPNLLSGQEEQANESNGHSETIRIGVEQLLKIQNEDGAWPYEGVYRVSRQIPVGYRIGGTAICCEALLYGTDNDNEKANAAIKKGVDLILKELEHPLMKPTKESMYDVRIWGHIYALDLFCRIKASDRLPELAKTVEPHIKTLTEAVIFQEIESGGWNYANRRSHAAFVTAPAVHSLLWAKHSGQTVPDEVLERAQHAMERSRNNASAYAYSGNERTRRATPIQGSIARSAVSEATLQLLGGERSKTIKSSLDAFHQYWDELEKRRKKTGTHEPPFGIAPYYFYYGHRYAAFAIQQLPSEQRAAEFKKLNALVMKTRDDDGTWNDRVFDRSRAYGTAMAIMTLLEEKVPAPKPAEQVAGGSVDQSK